MATTRRDRLKIEARRLMRGPAIEFERWACRDADVRAVREHALALAACVKRIARRYRIDVGTCRSNIAGLVLWSTPVHPGYLAMSDAEQAASGSRTPPSWRTQMAAAREEVR